VEGERRQGPLAEWKFGSFKQFYFNTLREGLHNTRHASHFALGLAMICGRPKTDFTFSLDEVVEKVEGTVTLDG